jgi:D-glycero-D-manno-heptose 1,7-bisphosphate phosphatase
MNKAVFFDRDDTLIIDVPYNGEPERVELMPGALEACRRLRQLGYQLFMVSNQSGVGRGLITEEQVHAVNARVLELLGKELFTDVYCCFEAPDTPLTNCRKPSPYMLLKAKAEHDLDLFLSFMIGDKADDIVAGKSAGCRTIWLNSKGDLHLKNITADFIATNLLEAVEWIKQLPSRVTFESVANR